MNKLTKTLGTGLLTLVAGCVNPETTSPLVEKTQSISRVVTLTPQERTIQTHRDTFSQLYGKAMLTLDTHLRAKNRYQTDTELGIGSSINKAVIESTLTQYKHLLGEMQGQMNALNGLNTNTDYMKRELSTLQKRLEK